MTYVRVNLRGQLGATEVWSVNPTFNCSVERTWDQAQGVAAAQAVAALAVPTPLQVMASANGKLLTVRVEMRSDTHQLLGAAEAPYTGGWTSSQTSQLPPQSAVVFSLRSDVAGARGRGRLYWPAVGSAVNGSTMRLSNPTTAAAGQNAVVYLTNIQNALKGALDPLPSLVTYRLCVVSKTSGTRTDINRLLVGDVIDTQRRRRDKLPEAYATTAFPAP